MADSRPLFTRYLQVRWYCSPMRNTWANLVPVTYKNNQATNRWIWNRPILFISCDVLLYRADFQRLIIIQSTRLIDLCGEAFSRWLALGTVPRTAGFGGMQITVDSCMTESQRDAWLWPHHIGTKNIFCGWLHQSKAMPEAYSNGGNIRSVGWLIE